MFNRNKIGNMKNTFVFNQDDSNDGTRPDVECK